MKVRELAVLAVSLAVITVVGPRRAQAGSQATGAALYRTNRGSFDVLFLPKPQNFDGLEIVERQENGEYLYSFAGHPTPWPANLIAGRLRTALAGR